MLAGSPLASWNPGVVDPQSLPGHRGRKWGDGLGEAAVRWASSVPGPRGWPVCLPGRCTRPRLPPSGSRLLSQLVPGAGGLGVLELCVLRDWAPVGSVPHGPWLWPLSFKLIHALPLRHKSEERDGAPGVCGAGFPGLSSRAPGSAQAWPAFPPLVSEVHQG